MAFRICRLIICNGYIKGMKFLQAWEMARVSLHMYPYVSQLDIPSLILIKLIASINFKKRQQSKWRAPFLFHCWSFIHKKEGPLNPWFYYSSITWVILFSCTRCYCKPCGMKNDLDQQSTTPSSIPAKSEWQHKNVNNKWHQNWL